MPWEHIEERKYLKIFSNNVVIENGTLVSNSIRSGAIFLNITCSAENFQFWSTIFISEEPLKSLKVKKEIAKNTPLRLNIKEICNFNESFEVKSGRSDMSFDVDGDFLVSDSQNFDREVRNQGTIKFYSEKEKKICKIHLLIKNLKNTPVFPVSKFNTFAEENSVSNDSIVKIIAFDSGFRTNSTLRYSIISPMKNFFSIDSRTGEIFLKRPLDREVTPVAKVFIRVKDRENPSLSAQAQLMVHIRDQNDQIWDFQKCFNHSMIIFYSWHG